MGPSGSQRWPFFGVRSYKKRAAADLGAVSQGAFGHGTKRRGDLLSPHARTLRPLIIIRRLCTEAVTKGIYMVAKMLRACSLSLVALFLAGASLQAAPLFSASYLSSLSLDHSSGSFLRANVFPELADAIAERKEAAEAWVDSRESVVEVNKLFNKAYIANVRANRKFQVALARFEENPTPERRALLQQRREERAGARSERLRLETELENAKSRERAAFLRLQRINNLVDEIIQANLINPPTKEAQERLEEAAGRSIEIRERANETQTRFTEEVTSLSCNVTPRPDFCRGASPVR